MAKFDKIAVMQKIGAAPMVPVFYISPWIIRPIRTWN